eukprot:14757475-Heterocapsa_arctica.AAC.1
MRRTLRRVALLRHDTVRHGTVRHGGEGERERERGRTRLEGPPGLPEGRSRGQRRRAPHTAS